MARARPILCLLFALSATTSCAAREPPLADTPPPAPASPGLHALPGLEPNHPPSAAADDAVATEELRAYALTRRFTLGFPSQVTTTPDGQAALFLRSGPRDPKQSLFETDLATGVTRELVSPESLDAGPETLSAAERARRERMRVLSTGFTSFELNEAGSAVLLSLSGRLFVYSRADGSVKPLRIGTTTTPARVSAIDPHFSPDGTRVAYVVGNDVYALDLKSGREVAVTHGGTDRITHGVAEFAAQEELDRTRGFWWSPDGSRIAFEEADTTAVERLRIADPAHPEREPEETAYPRAGTKNARVRFGIVASNGGAGSPTWVAYDRDTYEYAATVTWPRGGPVTLYVLDRLQKNGRLLAADPATGKTTTLVEEHDDAWLNVDPSAPLWLPDGRAFLWSSERSGQWQVELHDAKDPQAVPRVLSNATLGYRELVGASLAGRAVYVNASAEPSECGVVKLSLDGAAPTVIRARAGASISAHASRRGDVTALVVREATLSDAPTYSVVPVSPVSPGRAAPRALPATAEAPKVFPNAERVTVGPDSVRVLVIRPRTFDPARTYAVLDAVYGGPHVTTVETSGEKYVLQQWMADRADAVVVIMDTRGTPNRGRAWERALAGKLGEVPIDGHVATFAALGARFPQLDLTRIGVYGWSFGGFFAARAVLSRPDVYKAAFAGAPVTDWRDYDTAYTERYLGLPSASADAYDRASLLPLASARALTAAGAPTSPPRPLLLVHGTADDNVYFLNTLKLVDALEHGRRPFELFPVPGMTHIPRDPERVEEIFSRGAAFLRGALAPETVQKSAP